MSFRGIGRRALVITSHQVMSTSYYKPGLNTSSCINFFFISQTLRAVREVVSIEQLFIRASELQYLLTLRGSF